MSPTASASPPMASAGADADADALLAANPFPGLRAFVVSEARQFHGRKQQVAELMQRLAGVPLLAVAGDSGCGKSSLVLAGLLSGLARAQADGGDEQWLPVVMKPGDQPVASLARALAAVLRPPDGSDDDTATRAASLDGSLRLGSLGLVEVVRRARLQPRQRLLVVVDQFEEVFRFQGAAGAGEAAAFVKLLLTAANDPDVQLSTVLTLRSNELGRCADFRGLPEAVNRGQYLVPKLTREQRKQAIVAPVEEAGHRIAPRLVQRLLNDVSDDFDDLPVMQHALSRTWQQWARTSGGVRSIDLEDYEAIGGSAQALSLHADEAAASLGPWQPWVERVFRALTELTPEGSTNRDPLKFSTLEEVVQGPPGAVAAVVERYRRPDTALLMPPMAEPLQADPVIDISHESLIRLWKSLGLWVKAEATSRAQALALLGQVQERAELLRGGDLKRALDWTQREQPNAAWIERHAGKDGAAKLKQIDDYLGASTAAQQRDRLRRRWRVLAVSSLGLVIVVGSVIAAYTADKLQRQGRASELASLAMLRISLDPAYAAHVALAALDKDARNAKAELALRQAWSSLEAARTVRIADAHQGEPVVDMHLAQGSNRLLVATARSLQVRDAGSLQPEAKALVFTNDLMGAWPVDGGRQALALFADGSARLLALDGSSAQKLACPAAREAAAGPNLVYKALASPDGRELAIGCQDGTLLRWSVGAGALGPPRRWWPPKGISATTTALAYSHDSRYFASGDMDGSVRIWRQGQDQLLFGAGKVPEPVHSKAVTDIVFKDGDPRWLATGSDDLTASVWELDLERGRLVSGKDTKGAWHFPHRRPVKLVRFYQQDKKHTRLMSVSDTRVYFWGPRGEPDVREQADWIEDAQASEDGNFVISASNDGTARVWSTVNASQVATLAGHSDGVQRALFVPGQMQVITAGVDGTLRRWELRPPRVMLSGDNWLLAAALAPDGRRVAICGESGGVSWAHCSSHALNADGADGAAAATTTDKGGWRANAEAGEFDTVAMTSYSADGQWLVGSAMKHDITASARCKVWSADGAEVPLPLLGDDCRFAAFSAKSPWLLTVGGRGEMALWDTTKPRDPAPVPRRRWEPNLANGFVALSPDGRWAAAAQGKDVHLWDLQEADGPPRRLAGHSGTIKGLRFSNDSQHLVSASNDRSARVWRLRPGRELPDSVELAGSHTAALAGASFSPDGRLVATFGADTTIRVWDAATGRELSVLRWHGKGVNDAHFNATGDSILSVSDDGTAKFGRCDACILPLPALSEKVAQTPLSEEDERRLAAETLHLPWYRRWFGLGAK